MLFDNGRFGEGVRFGDNEEALFVADVPLDLVLVDKVGEHALHLVQVRLLSHPLQRDHEGVQAQARAVLQFEHAQK